MSTRNTSPFPLPIVFRSPFLFFFFLSLSQIFPFPLNRTIVLEEIENDEFFSIFDRVSFFFFFLFKKRIDPRCLGKRGDRVPVSLIRFDSFARGISKTPVCLETRRFPIFSVRFFGNSRDSAAFSSAAGSPPTATPRCTYA